MAAKNPHAPVETIIKFAKPIIKPLRALHRRKTYTKILNPIIYFNPKAAVLNSIDFGSARCSLALKILITAVCHPNMF